MPYTMFRPLEMSPAELDELFRSSPAGDIPGGRGDGTIVVASGTRYGRPLAAVGRALLWQGKVFSRLEPPRPEPLPTHELRNRLSPFGFLGLRAEVYVGDSLFDGRPCIVLDYSKSSKAARRVRDEIRQIGPGEYLGLVFVDSKKSRVRFALSFAPPVPP
jgi:hypothetical protein